MRLLGARRRTPRHGQTLQSVYMCVHIYHIYLCMCIFEMYTYVYIYIYLFIYAFIYTICMCTHLVGNMTRYGIGPFL